MLYLHKYETFKLALEKLERCKMSYQLKNNQNPTVRNTRLGFFTAQKGRTKPSDRPKGRGLASISQSHRFGC